MFPAFHPDSTYPAPFPLRRSAESLSDELLSKEVMLALKGETKTHTRAIRGWAFLNAILVPENADFLIQHFGLTFPWLSHTQDSNPSCSLQLTKERIARLFTIPNPFPTRADDAFFESDDAKFGLWRDYVTLYHKHLSSLAQLQNVSSTKEELMAIVAKEKNAYVFELTHKDKEFQKGTLGIARFHDSQAASPFVRPSLEIGNYSISRQLKYRFLNFAYMSPEDVPARLGAKTPEDYQKLRNEICAHPPNAQGPLWKALLANLPAAKTGDEFAPYVTKDPLADKLTNQLKWVTHDGVKVPILVRINANSGTSRYGGGYGYGRGGYGTAYSLLPIQIQGSTLYVVTESARNYYSIDFNVTDYNDVLAKLS
jgi:hypothetical protein